MYGLFRSRLLLFWYACKNDYFIDCLVSREVALIFLEQFYDHCTLSIVFQALLLSQGIINTII